MPGMRPPNTYFKATSRKIRGRNCPCMHPDRLQSDSKAQAIALFIDCTLRAQETISLMTSFRRSQNECAHLQLANHLRKARVNGGSGMNKRQVSSSEAEIS